MTNHLILKLIIFSRSILRAPETGGCEVKERSSLTTAAA